MLSCYKKTALTSFIFKIMADKRISQLVERTDIANNDVVPIVASGATTTNKATISSIQEFMQENLDLGVTSVGITLGSSGTDVSVTGSPITTSGNITINIPDASATARGVVTTGAQTFAGAKTFSNSIIAGTDLQLVAAGSANPTILRNTSGTTSSTTGSNVIGFNGSNNIFVSTQNNGGFILGFNNSVSNREYTLQDANGTLAFTTDLNDYVPYTGATGAVNLGFNNLDAGIIKINGASAAFGGNLGFRHSNSVASGSDGYTSISTLGSTSIRFRSVSGSFTRAFNLSMAILNPSGTERTYTLPDASGTLALTSDLAGYVTLGTAQTITGQKTFSTSGGSDTAIINHGSGSGIALNISKAGDGEAIRVTKTSGSGNAVTITGGNFEAPTIVRTGGTSSQFLMADGSVNTSVLPSGDYVTLATSQSITGSKTFTNSILLKNSPSLDGFILQSFSPNALEFGATISGTTYYSSIVFPAGAQSWNLPNASGTIALTSDLSAYLPLTGGTLTGALNGTSASFSAGINAIGQEKAFTWQRVSGASSSDVYSLNADSASTYLQNDTTSNVLMTWREGGNVGIGTASPTQLLELNGTSNLRFAMGASHPYIQTNNQDLNFGTRTADLMVIKSGGNVGIGTDSPAALLDVNGDALINDLTVGRGAGNISSNTALGNDALDSNTTGIFNTAVGYRALQDNTTGSNNTATGIQALRECTTGIYNTAVGINAGLRLTTGSNNLLLGNDAGRSNSPSGSITTQSNIVCLGNDDITDLYCEDTTISSSDSRDKTDVTDFTYGLDWITQLRPVTYRWDKRSWYVDNDATTEDVLNAQPDGSKKRSKLHLGFLAQEELEIEKQFGFGETKDDMLIANLNEDESRYGIKYERLVPVLVNAIKELKTEIDSLKNQIK
jgi:hypothetical protein